MEHSGRILRGKIGSPAWAAMQRMILWPVRVAAARQAMHELAGMSDRELADIRLTRQDLRDASALALGEDPTGIFKMRIAERGCR
jgi:uncharacterized protein YjiS (DUF1127 family)